MKKRRSSKVAKSSSNANKIQMDEQNLQKTQMKTQLDDSNKSMWKIDEVKLDLNEKSPVEQETIEFRDALAKSIIDQTDLGIKENIESIKPENLDNISALIPRDRHLLVPINVQALVVPSMEMGIKGDKSKANRNPELKNIDKPDLKEKTIKLHSQRAELKTDFRESKTNSDNEEYWGIPEAFDYTSSNPQTLSLIHI